MKTVKKLVLVGLAVSTLSNTWAQTAAETSKEINAQTTITRGFVDNLLEKVNQRKVDSRFNASDYLEQSQATKNKVEETLKNFEMTLEKDILSKASYWMDQYNAIYKSSDYSKEQKKILLAQRLVNIQNQFAKLSKDYQVAIKKVYDLVPNSDMQARIVTTPATKAYNVEKGANDTIQVDVIFNEKVKATTSFNVTIEQEKFFNHDVLDVVFTYKDKSLSNSDYKYRQQPMDGTSYTKVNSTKRHYGLEVDFDYIARQFKVVNDLVIPTFQSAVYPTIKASCKSAICVGLRAADYSGLVLMIHTMVDRDMTMSLADGETLSISGLHLNIDWITQMLTLVNYPEELPFDI